MHVFIQKHTSCNLFRPARLSFSQNIIRTSADAVRGSGPLFANLRQTNDATAEPQVLVC
jgi:hypothetical protein